MLASPRRLPGGAGGLLIGLMLCSEALAGSPFDGTWALNVGRSRVLPVTLSWQAVCGGRLRFTNLNGSYTFKPDGAAFTTPLGTRQTVRRIRPGLYEVVTRNKGALMTTETWTVSPTGNTLVMESRGTRPNGQGFDIRQTYRRASGTAGLIGDWTGAWKITIPQNVLTVSSAANGEATLTLSANGWTIGGRWDGKAGAWRGPGLPPAATATLQRTGEGAFRLTYRVRATVVEIDDFRLAAGGRSLIEQGRNATGRLLFVDVWDKRY